VTKFKSQKIATEANRAEKAIRRMNDVEAENPKIFAIDEIANGGKYWIENADSGSGAFG
jgi:hypothetical protein